MDGINVGQKIKELRMQRGMSQNQLARAAKVSQAGLSSIESGATSPSIQTLSIIAEALDVPLSYLFDDNSTDDEHHRTVDPDIRILERARESMLEEDWQTLMRAIKSFYPQFFE